MADRDGNGVLDPRSTRPLAAVYGASTDEAERAFAGSTWTVTASWTRAEFTTAISQFFASPDADAAGSLAFGRL